MKTEGDSVGSTVKVHVTSPDVVHGLSCRDNITMAEPGLISTYEMTFDETGEHLILCTDIVVSAMLI